MKKSINFNFKQHGNIDISSIKEHLKTLDWDAYTYRQDAYPPHANTKTVPLIWDHTFQSSPEWDAIDPFRNKIIELQDILRAAIGDGNLASAILINLPARKNIKRHVDNANATPHFAICHRIHVPIMTNPLCMFEVDGEVKNMKEGEIWEINNDGKHHSVENSGFTDRIHLLCDFKPTN